MDHGCDCKLDFDQYHPRGYIVTEECFRCAVKRVVADRRARRIRRFLLASIFINWSIGIWAAGRMLGAW